MQKLKTYILFFLLLIPLQGCKEIGELLGDCDGVNFVCVKPCDELDPSICATLLKKLTDSINDTVVRFSTSKPVEFRNNLQDIKVKNGSICNVYLKESRNGDKSRIEATFNGINIELFLDPNAYSISNPDAAMIYLASGSATTRMKAYMKTDCQVGSDSWWVEGSANLNASLMIYLHLNPLVVQLDNLETGTSGYTMTINPKIRLVPKLDMKNINVTTHGDKGIINLLEFFSSFGDLTSSVFEGHLSRAYNELEFALGNAFIGLDKLFIEPTGLRLTEGLVNDALAEFGHDAVKTQANETFKGIEDSFNDLLAIHFPVRVFTTEISIN